jgi:hypothetical protein
LAFPRTTETFSTSRMGKLGSVFVGGFECIE